MVPAQLYPKYLSSTLQSINPYFTRHFHVSDIILQKIEIYIHMYTQSHIFTITLEIMTILFTTPIFFKDQ